MKLQEIPFWLDKGFIDDEVGLKFLQAVVSVDMHCERQFYTDATMNWPLTVTRTTHHIGTSSITHKLTTKRHNAVMCSTFATGVLVDTKTGKSTPLPPAFYEKFKPRANGQRIVPMSAYPLPPVGQYYQSIVRVPPSDIDINQHLNISAYVRYCMDCSTEASYAGFLEYFQDQEIFSRKVSNVKILLLAECMPGDNLDVCVWNHPHDKDVLKFIIFKNGEQFAPVCRCVLRFHKVHSIQSNL